MTGSFLSRLYRGWLCLHTVSCGTAGLMKDGAKTLLVGPQLGRAWGSSLSAPHSFTDWVFLLPWRFLLWQLKLWLGQSWASWVML